MGSAALPPAHLPQPAVDDRLVMPETRYEIHDGSVVYVSPADEPHASRHAKLSALLEAYVREDYDTATDMLTRTSEASDIAPDASVFPRARDLRTGRRQLEELAFEVVSTERLGAAGAKARKLVGRGVRRVFAIDLESQRVLEWSNDVGAWQMLPPAGSIEEPVFVAPLPIAALVSSAKADDAVACALIAKHNPVIEREIDQRTAETKAHAVLEVLAARGLEVPEEVRRRVLECTDLVKLDAWIRLAATVRAVGEIGP